MANEQQPPAADNEQNEGEQSPVQQEPATPAAESAGQGGEESPTQEENIRNPEAYWKAQAEKYERLTAKQTDEAQKLQARLESMEQEQRSAIEAELKAIREETDKARQEVEAERARLLRTRIGTEYGLPDAIAARLRGDTDEAIRADAEELAKTLPKSAGQGTRMGNPAGDTGLTMEQIKAMTPAEYVERRDEVQAVLRSRSQKKVR